MLQQSCKLLRGYCSTHFILLPMKPHCYKIKQNIYFIAAFIQFTLLNT